MRITKDFCTAFGLTFIALNATPACAVTYTGRLEGSGYAYEDYLNYNYDNYDPVLNGHFTLDFTIEVNENYTDPLSNKFYKKYVNSTVTLTQPGYYLGSAQKFSLSNDNGLIDFTGNANSGDFSFNGVAGGAYALTINFGFSNASNFGGPITGGGSVTQSYGVPISDFVFDSFDEDGNYVSGYGYNISGDSAFSATRGFVSTSAPEPATWALMIVGFGAVGATSRQKRVRVCYPA